MIELNYKVFGEGEPVIILHGIFGMLDNWQTFGKKLAEDYQVFLVDQRDHGRSPHTEEFSYPILAADLKHFIETHNLVKPRLIGHSMGGKTVMEFLLMYPDLAGPTAVIDMGVKSYSGGHEYIMEALASVSMDLVQSRKEAESILSEKIDNQGVMFFLMKNFTRKKEGGYRWKINLPLLQSAYKGLMAHDLSERRDEGSTILFVRGGNSNYILASDIENILKVFPAAQVQKVDNAGHWIHAEQPEPLLHMISDFFRLQSS